MDHLLSGDSVQLWISENQLFAGQIAVIGYISFDSRQMVGLNALLNQAFPTTLLESTQRVLKAPVKTGAFLWYATC